MNLRAFYLGVLGGVAACALVAAGPFPSGVTRGTAPFHVSGNLGYIDPSTTAQPGYMTTAQAIALASLQVATPSPIVTNPIVWGTAGYTEGTGNVDTSGTLWGDTFTRPDGALDSTLPEFPYTSGFRSGLWVSNSGDSGAPGEWNVTGDAARSSANGNGTMLYADTGHQDSTTSVVVSVLDPASAPNLVFRVNSTGTNFWMLQYFSGVIYLQKCSAPPPALACTVVNSGSSAFIAGDTLEAVYAGSSIIGKVNGSTIVTATDSTYSSNTGAGVGNLLDVSGVNRFTALRDIGSTDTRTVVTSSGQWAMSMGQNARGYLMPGYLFDGPTDSGVYEVTTAVVLDSSLTAGTVHASGITGNTVQATVQLGTDDHPRGVCSSGRAGDINYDAGHFYGCNGSAWLQLDN